MVLEAPSIRMEEPTGTPGATPPETPPPETPMTRMFQEAAEAPGAVRRQLSANAAVMAHLGRTLRARKPGLVVTLGRGSSDHAATYAQYLIETRLGVATTSAAPSVSSLYAATPSLDGALCLAISQSGKSPDLLSAAQAAKDGGAYLVALVNAEDSPLAELADAVVPLGAGPELSVAATKSYITALTAIAQLVAAWGEDPALSDALAALPEHLEAAWELDWSAGVTRLKAARSLYVIGRGVGFAVAQEAALKFKETCGLHAEAFSAAEVRHGPMALVGPDFPALVFSQDDESRASVEHLVGELLAKNSDVLFAGAPQDGAGTAAAIPLPVLAGDATAGDPALQPILLVQSFYRMVNALALARGYDPDSPPHLNKVTETL